MFTSYNINEKATTIEDAVNYANYRNKQLLKFGYKVKTMIKTDKAVICKYLNKGHIYGAIYILNQFAGQGLYRELMQDHDINTIVTLPECGISGYLERNAIKFVSPVHSAAYSIIHSYYGDKAAKRSKVPLIYHIEEGGAILDALGCSYIVKDAYYLHPLLQNTKDFIENKSNDFYGVDDESLLLAMEYRMVANSYLSDMDIDSFLGLTCEEIRCMLIADKVQNYKDFLLYHKGKHVRSNELDKYFNNWFDILCIDYNSVVKYIAS